VLIMPGLQTADISAKILREPSGDGMIGPMLIGMEKPVQVAPMTSNASELVTLVVSGGGITRRAALRGPPPRSAQPPKMYRLIPLPIAGRDHIIGA
jgi:hypothetical protein